MKKPEVLAQIRDVRLRRELRNEQLMLIEDVVGWVTAKTVGLTAVFVGAMELISPEFLPFVLKEPEACIGFGMALILGKRFIGVAGRLLDAIRAERGERND